MALADNLVHYYSFDGSNANDGVGSLNGTSTSVTYSSGNGKLSVGGGFDGTNSRIVFSNTTLGIANAWTINGWYNPTSFANGPRFVYTPDSGANAIVLLFNTGGNLAINLNNSSSVLFKDYLQNANAFTTGSWQMASITWDGTNLKFYKNASEVTTTKTTDNAGTMTDTSRELRFSGVDTSGAARFTGNMDEIGIWSRALSGSELTELYNGGAGLAYPFASASLSRMALLGAG